MSNIYFSFQWLVIIHMRAQFKDNCVGTCAYVGCMCNVDIFIIFRKPLKRVWCTCSVCGLLHFSYMYVCYEWRVWTGYQSTVCGVAIKSRATNPHQVVFPCLEIGKVGKKKPRNSINSYLLATLMVFCNTVESFKAVEVNFCGLPHFYKSVGM